RARRLRTHSSARGSSSSAVSVPMRSIRRRLLSAILLCLSPAVLHAADCNRNGIEDALDIAEGTSIDCNGNDVPDECDVATSIELLAPLQLEIDAASAAVGDLDGDGTEDLAVSDLSPEVRIV